MKAPLVEARPAATVMLIRDSGAGIEVLMVRRRPRGFFGGPDRLPRWGGRSGRCFRAGQRCGHGRSSGPAVPGSRATRIGGGDRACLDHRWSHVGSGWTWRRLAFHHARRRDTDGRGGPDPRLPLGDTRGGSNAVRHSLLSRRRPGRAQIRIANDELVEHLWVAPGDALVMHAEGTLEMFLPTIAHLRWLERRSTVDDAVAAAQGADGRSLVEPRRMEDGSLLPIHLPPET